MATTCYAWGKGMLDPPPWWLAGSMFTFLSSIYIMFHIPKNGPQVTYIALTIWPDIILYLHVIICNRFTVFLKQRSVEQQRVLYKQYVKKRGK